MKKVYIAPEMSNLGEVMNLTKGNGGFGFQDLWRAIVNDDIHSFQDILDNLHNPIS